MLDSRTAVPATHYATVITRGPWWTEDEPSLRIPRALGAPVAIWSVGEGPDVLLVAPPGHNHNTWAPLSPYLRGTCTLHAIDRAVTSRTDDVDQIATAARAIGARCIAGVAQDSNILREAATRAPLVDQLLVLTAPHEIGPTEVDPRVTSVEVSTHNLEALNKADADMIGARLPTAGNGPSSDRGI